MALLTPTKHRKMHRKMQTVLTQIRTQSLLEAQEKLGCVPFSVPALGKFNKLRGSVSIPKFGIGDLVYIVEEDKLPKHYNSAFINGIEVERCLRYQIAGYKNVYKVGDEFGYSWSSIYEDQLISHQQWLELINR